MDPWTIIPWTVAGLLAARLGAQIVLERVNAREVLRHAGHVPHELQGVLDESHCRRIADYTLARGRFHMLEAVVSACILAIALFSGWLPAAFSTWMARFGDGPWSAAGFLFTVATVLSMLHWPLDWLDQFHLEQRFGFNTMTPRVWWLDRLKGLILSLLLLYPLLALLLHLAVRGGAAWWLVAWIALFAFQLLLLVVAPVLILPLFNKLTPVPDGPLRDRLLALARRAGFQTRGLQVMDGSKRSRHSNAFFTGLGRFRKIVLFDTLVEQLEPPELEAVLAHEIGHYRLRHVAWMLAASTAATGAGLWLLGWLTRQDGFYRAFQYPEGHLAAAFLLFGLSTGLFSFWLAPLQHACSRRFEYQADAYAAALVGTASPLISALRKLTRDNLSNPTPHPWYSRFYYSHPTLREREQALHQAPPPPAPSPAHR